MTFPTILAGQRRASQASPSRRSSSTSSAGSVQGAPRGPGSPGGNGARPRRRDAGSDLLGGFGGRESLEGLRGEQVERPNGELEVLRLRVLELRVGEPAEALDEEHHRRDSRA